VLDLVEDERCFSNLKFLKSCQRNRLGKHLPLVVCMFGQKYYILESFPYKEAIGSWKSAMKVGPHGDIYIRSSGTKYLHFRNSCFSFREVRHALQLKFALTGASVTQLRLEAFGAIVHLL